MTFARRVFTFAGIYGLLVLLPGYLMEARIGADYPPAITHPEYYYGFTGVAVAWQLVFLLIGRDPARYRPIMLAGIVEKASFGVATVVLFALGRANPLILAGACGDLVLGALFAISYAKTAEPTSP